ncbi:MAG: hypothetical protein AAFV88_18355, partial [Planctomycetota bacterium]
INQKLGAFYTSNANFRHSNYRRTTTHRATAHQATTHRATAVTPGVYGSFHSVRRVYTPPVVRPSYQRVYVPHRGYTPYQSHAPRRAGFRISY